MKLVPTEMPKRFYKKTKIQATLEEFENSDATCVRIENFPQKTAKGCASSFHNAAKRYHMNGIKVHMRNGKVYLVKEG